MTSDAPLPETVRFVAKLLATRPTHRDELPELIAAVSAAVSAVTRPAPPLREQPAESAAPAPPRRRGRPPGPPRPVFVAPEPAVPSSPPVPRLMRRAEMTAPGTPTFLDRATTKAALRGIVKWFDPRARVGALRLPGHDDVAVDGDALDRAGIARLYRGQEIEASIVIEKDAAAVRLVAVSLPGRPETESLLGGPTGMPRRNAKPVVIEMKRDAMRRTAARIEAEHLLGTHPRRA